MSAFFMDQVVNNQWIDQNLLPSVPFLNSAASLLNSC